jgi:prepilin-type N-terminal cleavage/methylation domain-containing protein
VIDRLRQGRGEAGYSLVEMLTVMVIMTVVFTGITTVFVAGSKAQADQDRRFQAQLSTRLALDKIRRDIHCANDVTPSTAASYPASSVTLKIPSGCSGGDVSWCTAAVTGYSNRYALYRQLGTTCGASGGVKVADYLTNTNGKVFPAFAHASGCGCLASLQIDFIASLKGSTNGAYELSDTIYLRNSTRI